MKNTSVTVSKDFGKIKYSLENLSGNTKRDINVTFGKFLINIFADISIRSPVDKGGYRADWEFKPSASGGNVLSAYSMVNNMPYAGVMEAGSPVGGKPWPSVGTPHTYVRGKNKGKTVGVKTIEKNGRIWSKQMPEPVAGGAIDSADWAGLQRKIANILSGGF